MRPCQNAMIGGGPPPRRARSARSPSTRQRSVRPSSGDQRDSRRRRWPQPGAAWTRESCQAGFAHGLDAAGARSSAVRRRRSSGRRTRVWAFALACAPFSMIEQNGQAVTTVRRAGRLQLFEALLADALALFVFLEEQAAAGAAAERIRAVARPARRSAAPEAREQIARLVGRARRSGRGNTDRGSVTALGRRARPTSAGQRRDEHRRVHDLGVEAELLVVDADRPEAVRAGGEDLRDAGRA